MINFIKNISEPITCLSTYCYRWCMLPFDQTLY